MRVEELEVEIGAKALPGDLAIPESARGIVVFAHGSGSSRRSPRNRMVARVLQEAGFATLLFDLLTPLEALDRTNVFDIALLGRRLLEAIGWAGKRPELRGAPLGCFGASTGAAAALVAAAEEPAVRAVVSRGGRPDLAGEALARVRAPVLLIVGERDEPVVELNRAAARRLSAPYRLVIVPGATHLFEEPGALEEVAALARDWFLEHLVPAPPGSGG
ncbi:MAG: dienelactone hydrolase family protein [Geminicoccaceae bacterium]|nr:dienelactone hydrolase family protein [Geminicoccaceae bacterium]MCX7630403.1 dienelactone hydrolase family protein [Geminicoccaceae bacterium]MDW8124117.1 dienelactone hydrolase family protein [Geminicoccaceae bacterium]MDW8340220.1 dienelactone hydrolase family protein [Geminicoccaceae bacterium]